MKDEYYKALVEEYYDGAKKTKNNSSRLAYDTPYNPNRTSNYILGSSDGLYGSSRA